MIILCVANNENDDDEGDADHIIVIIYCAVGVIIACISCMAALYCSEKIMEKRGGMQAFMCSSYLLHGSKQMFCLYKHPFTALCTQ